MICLFAVGREKLTESDDGDDDLHITFKIHVEAQCSGYLECGKIWYRKGKRERKRTVNKNLSCVAGKLMGAFLQGLNDRNSSVRKNYATALAHLVKVI